RELGQREAATAALEEYHRLGGHAPDALMRLADELRAAGRGADALRVLEDLLMVAPLSEELHAKLGDWLLEDGRAEDAVREFEVLLAMEPHDRANAHYRLARAYHAAGDADRTREQLLYALEIAP